MGIFIPDCKAQGRTASAIRPVQALPRALSHRRGPSPSNQRYDEQHEEDEEEYLRNTHRGARDTAEAEDGGDDCDNQECNCPRDHLI